jgi:hypothetical protein
LKNPLHSFLVLIAALLCFGAFISLNGEHPYTEESVVTSENGTHERVCSIKAVDWYVSSAENRVSSHSGPTYKTDEEHIKRKKQKLILAVFSQIKFSLAKVYSVNESLTSKRKPDYNSIITAHRQLRL